MFSKSYVNTGYVKYVLAEEETLWMLRNRTLRISVRRVCMHVPVHTRANPSAKKMTADMGREPSGAIFGQELRLPVARQWVNRGGPDR